ncbi:MAG: hypothetical protein IJQ39_09390, partial [Thermoguttaceae bacterium]|nr:hypothetical protein [Thermoguttaceae bacterium]
MRKLLMIGAAVALFAQLAAQAAVPSLELSLSQNAIKVTDSSRALDGASGLYLVWDSADRGTDLNAWPAANRVQYSGTIPSSDSVYE